jgi:hypothetical protein
MTETPEPKQRPERVLVKPDPDSRLAGLLCLYETRKSEADAAEAAYDELKASILAELILLHPAEEDQPTRAYDIPGSNMYPPLSYSYKSQFFLSNPLIRQHMPEVYEAFKVARSHWELRRGK